MTTAINISQKLKIKNAMIKGEGDAGVITRSIGLGMEAISKVEKYMKIYSEDPQVMQQGRMAVVRTERAELRAEGLATFDEETAKLVQEARVLKQHKKAAK